MSCRGFACGWLVNPAVGDEWFPARSKIVLRRESHGDIAILEFVVDPSYPDKWREGALLFRDPSRRAQGGFLVQVICTPLLEDNEVRYPRQPLRSRPVARHSKARRYWSLRRLSFGLFGSAGEF